MRAGAPSVAAPARRTTARIPAGMAEALMACLAARATMFLVVWVLRFQDSRNHVAGLVARWDGAWYMGIAADGYADGPLDTASDASLRFAFFPLWPWVLRASSVVGLPRAYWGLLVITLCSLVFTALLWRLVAGWAGEDEATWVATLAAFVPGSYVFTLLYAEPLFLVLAVGFFLLVRRQQWIGAGVTAAVAGLVRPTAVALVAALAWLAWRRWRAGARDWRLALAALAIAPLGLLGYFSFVWQRTGEPDAYLTVQRDGWGTGVDLGRTLVVDRLLRAVASPTYDWNAVVSAVAFVFAMAGLVLLIRRRPPGEWLVYTGVVLGLAFLNRNVTSTPRFVYTAFPVVIALGMAVPRPARPAVLALAAGVSAWILYLISTSVAIGP